MGKLFNHLEKANEIWDEEYYLAHQDYVKYTKTLDVGKDEKTRNVEREKIKRRMSEALKKIRERMEAAVEDIKELEERAGDLP